MKYFSLKYATLSVLVFASLLTPAISAQTLLFKSGFESGTTLGPVTGIAPTGPEQTISGTDSSTNFAWPITAFSPNPGLDGIHIVPPHTSTDANGNHFVNTLDTTNSHSGSRSLMLEMQGYPNGSCCAQNVLNMVGMSQSINSLYERVWVKLGPEVAQQIAANPSNFWRDLFEIKTQSDFRIITYVYKNNSSSTPYFFVQSDNGALNSPTQTFWQSSCLASGGCNVAVPLNQWFLEEIYLKRSSGSDGQFFFAINGQTVVNKMGPNYGGTISNQPIYQWMIQNEYGEYFPMQEWVDDLELWSNPPCATLPCGSGTSSGTPTTTAPSITSTSLPAATVATSYSQAISATGTTPLVWSVTSGTLPSGFSLSSSGVITGTPAAAGSSSFAIQASNAAGSASQQFSLTVNPKTTTSSWFELVSKNSGKCLDVSGASIQQNVQLQQYTCNARNNQMFQFTPVSGGYKITNKNSGLGLNIRGGSSATQNGAAVIQWPFSGGSNEIWNTHPNVDGTYTITVNSSGKCMNVANQSTSDGALIQQWQCTGARNQEWSLVPLQ